MLDGAFPAHAGVIPAELQMLDVGCSFPRIRGGDPNIKRVIGAHWGFSPHTRG